MKSFTFKMLNEIADNKLGLLKQLCFPAKIVEWDSLILNKVSTKIPNYKSEQFKQIIKQMFKLLEENKGVGLAAPQIGIHERYFIISYNGKKLVCIDPKIQKATGEQIFEEGCLSFPDFFKEITRPSEIKVSFLNENGNKRVTRLKGFEATIFQHELDHLNGVTIND